MRSGLPEQQHAPQADRAHEDAPIGEGREAVAVDEVERVLRYTNRSNPILPLPSFVGKLLAFPMGILPKPLVTGEQVTLLGIDNVVSPEAVKEKRTLQGMGITPRPLDAVLPSYIWRFSANGQFDRQTA